MRVEVSPSSSNRRGMMTTTTSWRWCYCGAWSLLVGSRAGGVFCESDSYGTAAHVGAIEVSDGAFCCGDVVEFYKAEASRFACFAVGDYPG